MSDAMVEKWTRTKALAICGVIERMDLCACGTSAHWDVVLFLLERGNRDVVGWEPDKGFYSPCEDASARWVEFAAKVLDGWNLLEHGGGIGGAWLTDDGKLLLEFLHDFGIEDADINDGSGHPDWSIEFSWGETPQDDDTYSEWARASKEKQG